MPPHFRTTRRVLFVVALPLALFALVASARAGQEAVTPPGAPAVPGPTFAKKPRRAQSRTVVPDEVLALLPWKGIYASGGGSTSPAWRVVVTLEGDLRAGSNPRPGSSTTALVDKKRTKLGPDVLAQLLKLADRAWREKPARRSGRHSDIGDDTFEILVVADGEDVFLLDPKGPITGRAAAELLTQLKAQAASR
jgi:hypothetical protein